MDLAFGRDELIVERDRAEDVLAATAARQEDVLRITQDRIDGLLEHQKSIDLGFEVVMTLFMFYLPFLADAETEPWCVYRSNMRVFVTGGSGFVGSFLVRELLARGHELTLLTRDPCRVTGWGVDVVEGSLTDFDPERLRGHHALIHNAIVWEDEHRLDDVRLSLRLFQAALECGVERAIFTSSTAVHRPYRALMNEDTPLRPSDVYGATKAASETMLWASKLPGDVVRAGPVVCAPAFKGAPFKAERRVAELFRAARANEDLRIRRDEGLQCIAGVDLAKVYAALLDRDPGGQTFIATSADFITWEEIAREALELTSSTSRVLVDTSDPQHARFDVSKLDRELSLRFAVSGRANFFIAAYAHAT